MEWRLAELRQRFDFSATFITTEILNLALPQTQLLLTESDDSFILKICRWCEISNLVKGISHVCASSLYSSMNSSCQKYASKRNMIVKEIRWAVDGEGGWAKTLSYELLNIKKLHFGWYCLLFLNSEKLSKEKAKYKPIWIVYHQLRISGNQKSNVTTAVHSFVRKIIVFKHLCWIGKLDKDAWEKKLLFTQST